MFVCSLQVRFLLFKHCSTTARRTYVPKGKPARGNRGSDIEAFQDLSKLSAQELDELVESEHDQRHDRLQSLLVTELPKEVEIPDWFHETVEEFEQLKPVEKLTPESKRWWKLLRRQQIKSNNQALARSGGKLIDDDVVQEKTTQRVLSEEELKERALLEELGINHSQVYKRR
mmetsp:Transcript_21173/g.31511  ORF Transcript_21173/g.31511 Transcript_21173/m.31511 type:complete len:173 (-) Transcript_21173:100-618(-)